MNTIKTINKISAAGLSLFGSKFDVSPDHEDPAAIIVRSAKVDTDEYKSLLAVGRAGAGYNNITVDSASERGICVFNTPGANANAVCELVLFSLGMVARNIHQALVYSETLKDNTDDADINNLVEKQKSSFAGFELAGKRMAIIGLGKIGVLVANAAQAMGMEVIGYEPFPNLANIHQLHRDVELTSELSVALAKADFASIHVPLLDGTKGLFNRDTIAKMKDDAILLNFSRGPVVDTDSVIAALDAGKLKYYINDFPSNALLNHPKAICTPHLGASTGEAEENCATMAVNQLRNYIEFGEVVNSVNFPRIEGRPSASVKSRIIVINKDMPNTIAEISKVIGEAGFNIHSFKNESNGKIGYNMIDLTEEAPADLIEKLGTIGDKVIKVRHLRFY